MESPDPRHGSDDELLRRHLPILRFDERELFFPTSATAFAQACTLWSRTPSSGRKRAARSSGRATATRIEDTVALEDLDGRHPSSVHLRFVSDDERRDVLREDVRRTARKLLKPRLGRVGLFGRFLDALFLLSIWLRPTTPRLTSTAASVKAERLGLHDRPVCYGRVVRGSSWVVLHYCYFFVMNDWRTSYRGVNDHEGDWEQAWVFLDPADLRPIWVGASSHDHAGADLRRHWADEEPPKEGDRPVLFPGAGSHALFFEAGDYVSRIDVPALRWLLRLQRWTHRVLAIKDQATERGLGPSLGAPFVDLATGNGRHIADWDLEPLDDSAPWLGSFKGLWGLDAGQRAAGERGPSGPKFDRRGQVRRSWADPAGFVGLLGVEPPSSSASPSSSTGQDLRRHLRNPAIGLPPPAASGWILALWAALSVPLLLLAVAAVFLFEEARLAIVLLAAGAGAVLLEQLARRRYQAFVRLLAVGAAVVVAVLFSYGVAVVIGRYLIGVGLVLAALLLFVANLSELRAVQAARSAARSGQADQAPNASIKR